MRYTIEVSIFIKKIQQVKLICAVPPSSFCPAHLHQPAGGGSVQPGQWEESEDPVQSGLQNHQLRKLPRPLRGKSHLPTGSGEMRRSFSRVTTNLSASEMERVSTDQWAL